MTICSWGQPTCVQIPASLPVLSDGVFLGPEVHLSEPQCPHLQPGDKKTTHLSVGYAFSTGSGTEALRVCWLFLLLYYLP